MAGALAESAPARELGIRWRLSEHVHGFAAVYGIEIYGGVWPEGVEPTLRLRGGRIVGRDRRAAAAPPALADALKRLQVESWEAVATETARAFRFRPLGAMYVLSLLPPMRYTRGLSAEETAQVVTIWKASAELVALPAQRQAAEPRSVKLRPASGTNRQS